jgi:HEAT repeat protein
LRLTWFLMPLLLTACLEEKPVVAARDERLISESPRERTMAAPEMEMGAGRMEGPRAGGAEALTSRSAVAREEAVLDFEGDLTQLAPLATEDANAAVRVAAVQRLADGETPVARSALRRALEDDDPDVLAEAILAVMAGDDRKAVPALRRLRTHPDDEVRGLAEDALTALAP